LERIRQIDPDERLAIAAIVAERFLLDLFEVDHKLVIFCGRHSITPREFSDRVAEGLIVWHRTLRAFVYTEADVSATRTAPPDLITQGICNGCTNYHGQTYRGEAGSNWFCCAIHPTGPAPEGCGDRLVEQAVDHQAEIRKQIEASGMMGYAAFMLGITREEVTARFLGSFVDDKELSDAIAGWQEMCRNPESDVTEAQ